MIMIFMFLIGFVVGLGTMAIAGAKGVKDALKLGYEMGRKAEKEKTLNAIDKFAERLKDMKGGAE